MDATVQVVSIVGLCMVFTGELIRKTGMLTAQHNFSHDIKVHKAERHVLVTNGIYRCDARCTVHISRVNLSAISNDRSLYQAGSRKYEFAIVETSQVVVREYAHEFV